MVGEAIMRSQRLRKYPVRFAWSVTCGEHPMIGNQVGAVKAERQVPHKACPPPASAGDMGRSLLSLSH